MARGFRQTLASRNIRELILWRNAARMFGMEQEMEKRKSAS
jgi:hypothetical protein